MPKPSSQQFWHAPAGALFWLLVWFDVLVFPPALASLLFRSLISFSCFAIVSLACLSLSFRLSFSFVSLLTAASTASATCLYSTRVQFLAALCLFCTNVLGHFCTGIALMSVLNGRRCMQSWKKWD